MINLEMLDVAIGLILVYLFLSLICTAINEFIEAKLKLRAVDLEQGIRELFQDWKGTELTQKIYKHPLIFSLYRGTYDPEKIKNAVAYTSDDGVNTCNIRYPRNSDLPSYIPASNFAIALIDILKDLPSEDQNIGKEPNTAPVNPFEVLKSTVVRIENTELKTALLSIINTSNGTLDNVKIGIENWYNSSMDRVSGWYKRRVQKIVFWMGSVLAIVMNVDSFAIFKNLVNDRPLRSAIVSQVSSIDTAKCSENTNADCIRNRVNGLLELGLPIGWDWKNSFIDNARPNAQAIPLFEFDDFFSYWSWLLKLLGWIVTGLAVSLGASFWFDILNKIMVIRSTVKPHEKSREEGSEDRQ